MKTDTIAAIATAMAGSGIGIVRISGEEAVSITDQIFHMPGGKKLSDMETHTIHYGHIRDGEEVIDEVMVLLMRGPRSYTREDTVEIDCHGGVYVMKRILETVIKYGARPAEPGEFTKRAFLNGRIDLSQAESVIDVISAKNEFALKSSMKQLSGAVSDAVKEIRGEILHEIAFIESALDDPEHISLDGYGERLELTIEGAVDRIEKLLASSDNGRILKEGIRVSIAGIPNAGKSSLLNLLSGYDRAIVTEIPGTTRDTIEETIDYEGIPILLTDTAGLRETSDVVEKIGVDRSYEAIESSDIVVFLADISDSARARQSKELLEEIRKTSGAKKNIIVVLNKSDIEQEGAASFFEEDSVRMSVKEDRGTELLLGRIRELMQVGAVESNETVITSERHKSLIDRALGALRKAEESYRENLPLDCISYDIWECGKLLGEITGDSIEEDVMDTIFSKFCLGK